MRPPTHVDRWILTFPLLAHLPLESIKKIKPVRLATSFVCKTLPQNSASRKSTKQVLFKLKLQNTSAVSKTLPGFQKLQVKQQSAKQGPKYGLNFCKKQLIAFVFASAFRPVWPGRCVVLSLSLCTTSRLAPWTRGESSLKYRQYHSPQRRLVRNSSLHSSQESDKKALTALVAVACFCWCLFVRLHRNGPT